jgi:hypothetical protein
VTPYGDTALAHLNRVGQHHWELVTVSEDPSMEGTNELHRYHLKRPVAVRASGQRARLSSRIRRSAR